jgi:hypothetical protein
MRHDVRALRAGETIRGLSAPQPAPTKEYTPE